MKTQHLLILGSTGSIGTQVLDIVRTHVDKLSIFGLTANSNWKLLAEQINEFRPEYGLICDENCYSQLKAAVSHSETELLSGVDAVIELVQSTEVDTVVNSLVGFSGFLPTFHALSSGKKVALANKESLVVGGELLTPYLNGNYERLIPIDSEHSAILQCLAGEQSGDIEKLIVTASGGPFRTWSKREIAKVTVNDALKHPSWDMGAKITIDSATMMNKGLELIEAHWLFGIPIDRIEAVIHPQSIIHSMVMFLDGSMKAQLGLPDMRLPIQYALAFPERWPYKPHPIDWSKYLELNFEPVDFDKFPCFNLAIQAVKAGNYVPAVLNASNEVAVDRFLKGEIPYIRIAEIVEDSMTHITNNDALSVESIETVDRAARAFARTI
ncbi:MAG: 1-deoxy-D-xylulose-5-phosphate reductoisomerase [Balneolales bacterium]